MAMVIRQMNHRRLMEGTGRGGTVLVEDFKPDALSQLHARRAQDAGDGFDNSPLTAYHFPEVARMDAQFEHNDLFTLDHADLNLIGVIDERLCNRLY
jgi:hypothetical protein